MTTPTSINRWPVIRPGQSGLHTFHIPGTKRRVTLQRDAGPVLVALAADYHRDIKPIDVGTVDEGGYNYRPSRVSSRWSNHASGTAIDINWSKEGSQAAWTERFWRRKDHRQQIQRLMKVYGPIVNWGGGWHARYRDPMHFEIKAGVTKGQIQSFLKRHHINSEGIRE